LAKLWFGTESKDDSHTTGGEIPSHRFGGEYIINELEVVYNSEGLDNSEGPDNVGGSGFKGLKKASRYAFDELYKASDETDEEKAKLLENWTKTTEACGRLIERLRAEFELIQIVIRDQPRHSYVPVVYEVAKEDFRSLVAKLRNPEFLSMKNPAFATELLKQLNTSNQKDEEVFKFGDWLDSKILNVGLCAKFFSPQAKRDYMKLIKWGNEPNSGRELYKAEMDSLKEMTTFPKIVTAGKMELLSEFIYTLMRRAKLEQHAWETDALSTSNGAIPFLQSPEAVQLWLQVSVLSNLLLEARSLMSPDDYETEYRIRLKTMANYGLALGRLGRFFEAHRRLKEATALLVQRSGFKDYPAHIQLILRRAEVSLLEARHIRWLQSGAFRKTSENSMVLKKPFADTLEQWRNHYLRSSDKDTALDDYDENLRGFYSKHGLNTKSVEEQQKAWRLERLRIGRLDEAWGQVERAEQLMRGRSQSKLWWSRLHALQLRIIGEHYYGHSNNMCGQVQSNEECDIAFSSLAFRERYDTRDRVAECFSSGVTAAPRDVFRYIRLLHYLLDAMRTAIAIESYPHGFGPARTKEYCTKLIECVSSVHKTWVHRELLIAHYSEFSSSISKFRSAYTGDGSQEKHNTFESNNLLTQYAFKTVKQMFKEIFSDTECMKDNDSKLAALFQLMPEEQKVVNARKMQDTVKP
jgi:hypothetical protein